MMEKTKAWQTWVPVWLSIFLMAIGWGCSIFYQAGRNQEALENLTQEYKSVNARLDTVNGKVDEISKQVDQMTGYLRGMQARRKSDEPPARR